jgi:hypothetical protein
MDLYVPQEEGAELKPLIDRLYEVEGLRTMCGSERIKMSTRGGE